jgi:hypothetical protein
LPRHQFILAATRVALPIFAVSALALPTLALPTLAWAGPFDAIPDVAAAETPPRVLSFAVMRNGKQIGQYSMEIETVGKTQTVKFLTDIKVDVLMFTAYQMHHEGREVWTNGAFVSYKGSTDDNGKKHSVSMTANATGASLVVDGKHSPLPKGDIPGTIWNNKFVNAKALIDPDDGKSIPITVDDLGPDPIQVEGEPITAHHYHIGGLERDVWLSNGSPVRFQLKGSDNSTIVSELQPAPPAP